MFDLDGTLIDSVYQHVLAWKSSLDQEGIPLSVWRIHRKIGMSGGLFTNILLRETGFDSTPERLERLRFRHAEAYKALSAGVRFFGSPATSAGSIPYNFAILKSASPTIG